MPDQFRPNQHHADVTPDTTEAAILNALDMWERAGCDCCSPTVLDEAMEGITVEQWERIRRWAVVMATSAQWCIDEEAGVSVS